jgi:hypothetical protein
LRCAPDALDWKAFGEAGKERFQHGTAARFRQLRRRYVVLAGCPPFSPHSEIRLIYPLWVIDLLWGWIKIYFLVE